jgi:hypothetical protein
VGHDPTDRRQPEQLRFSVELSPQDAGLCARRPRGRVDLDAFHRRQVDHEPVVAERLPADSVATGADRDEQVALAREAHSRDHVGNACAARDAGRTAVDRAVPDPAGGVVAGAGREQQLSAERFAELVEGGRLQRRCLRPGSHASNVGLPAGAD